MRMAKASFAYSLMVVFFLSIQLSQEAPPPSAAGQAGLERVARTSEHVGSRLGLIVDRDNGNNNNNNKNHKPPSVKLTIQKRNNASSNPYGFGFGFLPLSGDSLASAQRICLELEAFRCLSVPDERDTGCIEFYLTCDNVQHCQDGSDEWCDNKLENCACKGEDESCDPVEHVCKSNNAPQSSGMKPTKSQMSWNVANQADDESQTIEEDDDLFDWTVPNSLANSSLQPSLLLTLGLTICVFLRRRL